VSGRLSRRALLGAAGAGVVGAAGAAIALEGSRSGSSASGIADDERRNVVLIVLDSLRADHVGAYGDGAVRTPNLDALARESLRFVNCHPEAMPTVPARRTLLTGRRAWPFRDWERWGGMVNRPGWEPIAPGADTIVRAFRRQGWWTAMVTDNPFLGFSKLYEPVRRSPHRFVEIAGPAGVRRPLTDVPKAEALRRLPAELRVAPYVDNVRQYLANNGLGRDEREYSCARVFTSAAAALDAARRVQRPFFLYVDGFDPHELWAPPPAYMGIYADPGDVPIADVGYRSADYMSADELARLAAGYKAEVTLADRWLGHFLDRLYELGLEDSTAIGLVSDHGVYVGERDWTGKSDMLLHPELTNVPLLIRDPDGAGANTESDWWATTVDVPRTLMELAGARVPSGFEGADLTPLLRGESAAERRRYAHGGYGNYSFVRDERWVYIAANDRSYERLYDRRADPGETRDVAARERATADAMWERIVAEAGGTPPPMYGEPDWLVDPRTSF